MPNKCSVISVIYKELEWADTERCLEKLPKRYPIHFVDRRGVGSLAKALNSGFNAWANGAEYVWFVTNVLFSKQCLDKLVQQMEQTGYAAISPAFQSDHRFCRPIEGCIETREAPFLEFTAPIVRAEVFKQFPLDENMPYWGHDLDWGYRVRKAGHKLGVYYGEQLGHVYIRYASTQNNDRITARRYELRRKTNQMTRIALIAKYGAAWKRELMQKENEHGC